LDRRVPRLTALGIGLACLATLAAGRPALAALRTDVADAADTIVIGDNEVSDAFDLYLGADFDSAWQWGKVTREPINLPRRSIPACNDPTIARGNSNRLCVPVYEMAYNRNIQRLNARLEIGIFHDLSLVGNLPIVIGDSLQYSYVQGIDQYSSSIDRPGTGPTNYTIFPNNFSSKHMGLGALDLGMRWAPLSDERDDSKPMWLLYVTWGIPYTATTHDPAHPKAPSVVGNPCPTDRPCPVGDGVHRLTFGTAFSRRIGSFGLIGISSKEDRRGYIDPYFDLSYTAPFPTASHSPEPLVYNNVDPIPRGYGSMFGTQPSHIAKIASGFEVVAFESLKNGHKIAFDLGFRGEFHTNGRDYSEVSDALGELTYVEQYFLMGGEIAVNAAIAGWVRLNIGWGIGYTSEHLLTSENAGMDNDGKNGIVSNDQDPTSTDYLNPYYCRYDPNHADTCSRLGIPSYDQVGQRFRAEEQVTTWLTTTLLVTF
jgi:hypothetical protein